MSPCFCGQDRVDVKFITDPNGNNTQEEVAGDWLMGHITRMEEMRNAYKIAVGKYEGERLLKGNRHS